MLQEIIDAFKQESLGKVHKEAITEITKDDFCRAIALAIIGGTSHSSQYAESGSTIFIHGTSRVEQVSIRNYNGDPELLITDTQGKFLFYGRFARSIGIELLTEQYFNIFLLLRDQIKDSSDVTDHPLSSIEKSQC
ncbi:hypothetical protein [Runella sp.]|uniref:hypothetical protein n=1 Tax=Runella sp. TaxID=1960881 RepID=UPI003D0AE103